MTPHKITVQHTRRTKTNNVGSMYRCIAAKKRCVCTLYAAGCVASFILCVDGLFDSTSLSLRPEHAPGLTDAPPQTDRTLETDGERRSSRVYYPKLARTSARRVPRLIVVVVEEIVCAQHGMKA